MKNIKSSSLVTIGKICKTYGILGYLKVLSFTEKKENIINYQPWIIKNINNYKLIKIEKWSNYNNYLIIKFKNFSSPEKACLLVNRKIKVIDSVFPNLNNNEYYWKDLLKCSVFNEKHYKIGKVINIIETGSNDVLVIKSCFNRKNVLIPFIYGSVIKKIYIKDHIILVNWSLNFI